MTSYHENFDCVGKTMLSHFMDSVEDYFHYYIKCDAKTPEPTSVMEVGSCVHEVLLERKELKDVCSLWPLECLKKNGAINPKPAAEMQAAYPSIRFVKEPVLADIAGCIAAVEKHPLGQLLSIKDLVFEQPVFWEDAVTGLSCKWKADFLHVTDSKVVIYDLKVTEQIKPRDFNRISRRLRYWLQDAHYSSAFINEGKPIEFVFWLVEPKFPYRVSPRVYSSTSRSNAREAYLLQLRRLAQCYDTGSWKDEWTQKKTFIEELSPWDVGTNNEGEIELEGFDDDSK